MYFLIIAISTFGRRIENIILPEEIQNVGYMLVHQTNNESFNSEELLRRSDVIYVGDESIGISKSRNIALLRSRDHAKYVHIMDDDVKIDTYAILNLAKSMEKDGIDIGTGIHAFHNGELSVEKTNFQFSHTLISMAKVSSIDLCLNLKSVYAYNIEFDETFGLGTSSPSGEEYVFLADALRSGLKIDHYPIVIGTHPDLTSGMDFYSTKNKIIAKRRMLNRVFGKLSFIFIIAFWIKKIGRAKEEGCALNFTKGILIGK